MFCEGGGRLCTSAIAGSPYGQQLAEVLNDGIRVDVLSWEMNEEEPDAAGIISEALNLAHQLAMAMSEISAVSAPNGETIATGGNRSQGIPYATVRNKIRQQSLVIVDDQTPLKVLNS